MTKDALLEQVKTRFKLAQDAEEKQRRREQEDLRFQVPEEQWSAEARQQREGGMYGGMSIPARPILSIPKLEQPIGLVLNQEKAAKLGVNIHPLSEDATDDTADVYQRLYRSIERDSRASVVRSWAFGRAVRAGRGYYRVMTEFDPQGGHPFDQKVVLKRLLYQDCVYMDPAAQEPNGSDAEWAFITSMVPRDMFKAEYPGASVVDDSTFEDLVRNDPEWVNSDGQQAVRVAEYFYKVHEYQTLVMTPDGKVWPQDRAPAEFLLPNGVRVPRAEFPARKRDNVKVMWAKVTAFDVLDEEEWMGKYIPIIPVIGEELQPYDKERRFIGMVRNSRDAQRLFNYGASSLVEMAALEPRAPFTMDPRQIEGYEAFWQQSNTRNFPYLPYKAVNEGGQPLPPPQRVQADTSRMGASMMLIDKADDFIQSSTRTFDASLGNLSERERSGKAILALQSQSDAGNSHYLHNLADAMEWEATIVLDLAPSVYDRPGRLARVLDEEDNSEMVVLNAPFIPGKDGARPRRLSMAELDGRPMPKDVKVYDLTTGRYGVSVSIGRSWQSRLQQGADEIGQILQAAPALMPLIGPVYFRFRDFPGAKEIADILKKVQEKQFPDLAGDEQGPSPDQAKAMLQQASQENAMLKAQLQQAVQAIETEQAKQVAQLQKAQMDNAAREEVARIGAESRLAVERIQAQTDLAIKQMEQRFEAMKLAAGQVHERRMADRAVEREAMEKTEGEREE